MEVTKVKSFNPDIEESTQKRGGLAWYLSCGMLILFFIGLLTVLGIIFTIFGKIILAMFMTE